MKKISFLSLILVITTYSSFAQGDLKPIPDDFDARNTILLIEDSPNEGRSDMMERVLQKYYPYKYKIVSYKDVRGIRNDTAYADKPEYRYIIANDERVSVSRNSYGTVRGYAYEVYNIYDMKEKRSYPVMRTWIGFFSGSFRHDIKALVKHMSELN